MALWICVAGRSTGVCTSCPHAITPRQGHPEAHRTFIEVSRRPQTAARGGLAIGRGDFQRAGHARRGYAAAREEKGEPRMITPTPRTASSVTLTRGFRIAVAPSYVPEHSEPDAGRFVFGYRI